MNHALPTPEMFNLQAAIQVEQEIVRLAANGQFPQAMLEKRRSEHRVRCRAVLTNNGRRLLEEALRQLGILKLDNEPGSPNWALLNGTDWKGGEAA